MSFGSGQGKGKGEGREGKGGEPRPDKASPVAILRLEFSEAALSGAIPWR